MKTNAVRNVTAFIDWNSQFHGLEKYVPNIYEMNKIALKKSIDKIEKLLRSHDKSAYWHLQLRFYHGWLKGYESTANYKVMKKIFTDPESPVDTKTSFVIINFDVGYGHRLISPAGRIHPAAKCHLPNTLRVRNDGKVEEKMVDTALAVDLLVFARQTPSDFAIIVGDDDDVIPPLLVADEWMRSEGGVVKWLCGRKPNLNFYDLKGILYEE